MCDRREIAGHELQSIYQAVSVKRTFSPCLLLIAPSPIFIIGFFSISCQVYIYKMREYSRFLLMELVFPSKAFYNFGKFLAGERVRVCLSMPPQTVSSRMRYFSDSALWLCANSSSLTARQPAMASLTLISSSSIVSPWWRNPAAKGPRPNSRPPPRRGQSLEMSFHILPTSR